MPYGTMGGEGQPQTQAAVFTRYARFGQPLQQAVSAPRWLLGRTWGDVSTSLKLENRFDPALVGQEFHVYIAYEVRGLNEFVYTTTPLIVRVQATKQD